MLKKMLKKKIKIINNFDLKKVSFLDDKIRLISKNNIFTKKIDLIINTTMIIQM